jgi:hypothetical protein
VTDSRQQPVNLRACCCVSVLPGCCVMVGQVGWLGCADQLSLTKNKLVPSLCLWLPALDLYC